MKALIIALLGFAVATQAQVNNPSLQRPIVTDGTTITGNGTQANPLVAQPQAPATPFNCEVTGLDAGGNKTCVAIRQGQVKASSFAVTAMPVQSAAQPYRGLVYDTVSGQIKAEPIVNTLSDVLTNTLTTPPASPALNDAHIVPAGATGAWAGQASKIAKWTGASWTFYSPLANDATTVTTGANAGTRYVFNGATWVIVAAITSPNWVLGGNALTANSALGSSNNVDWTLRHNNQIQATVRAAGITLPNSKAILAANSAGSEGRVVVVNGSNQVYLGAIDAAHTATLIGSGANNAFTAIAAGGATRYQCTSSGCTLTSGGAGVGGLTFANMNATTAPSGVAGTAANTIMCINSSGGVVTCSPPAATPTNYTSSSNNSPAFTLPAKQITYRANSGAFSATLPPCVLGDWTTLVVTAASGVTTYSANVQVGAVAGAVYTAPFNHQLVCSNTGVWTKIN